MEGARGVWVVLTCLGAMISSAIGQGVAAPAKPLLDGMTAVQLSLDALRPSVAGDGAIGGVSFDAARGQWSFRLDRRPGPAPGTLVISLDEGSGAVCARLPGSAPCMAQGSVQPQLQQARERRAAAEEAVRHPAPDLQGVMIALVRYQASAPDGYLHANRMPLYVRLHWPDGDRHLDLSPEAIRRLAGLGFALFPGSAWNRPVDQRPTGSTMAMDVVLPVRRSDGDYEVRYGFYCGTLCASWHTAVLHHDAAGWHVVSSRMDAIS